MSNKHLVVAFVDALGPTQLAEAEDAFAFAPRRHRLGGPLGYTSGALATILTGALPHDHGRMCLFARTEDGGPGLLEPLTWLGLLPKLVHERKPVRRLAERALAYFAGLHGYVALHKVPPEAFAWLDLPERDDLFQAPHVGGQPTFLARARAAGLGVYAAPWQLPEDARWRHVEAALGRESPDLTFLYSSDLDGVLHRDGPGSPAGVTALRRTAARVESVVERLARRGGDVEVLVVGDHGMAAVHHHVDPRPALERAHGVRAFVDATMLRLWGSPEALGRVRLAVERARWRGDWLDTAALDHHAVPTHGSPYGDAIFVLQEGAVFVPSHIGGAPAGMHGYVPGQPSANAALATTLELEAPPHHLSDVAGVVLGELGL